MYMEQDINGKRLSISFFINTNLKPNSYDEVSGEYEYVLYTQVIYVRQVTRFKTLIYSSERPSENELADILIPERYDTEEKLNNYLSGDYDIDEYQQNLLSILKYEIQSHKDKFKLKGLSKRLAYYHQSVSILFEDKYREKLFTFLADYLPYNKYLAYQKSDLGFISLLEILSVEYPDIYGKIPQDIVNGERLTKYLNKKTSDKELSVIDLVVNNDIAKLKSDLHAYFYDSEKMDQLEKTCIEIRDTAKILLSSG